MKTGQFIKQLKSDLDYKAFIPNKLPIEVNYAIVRQDLLSKADQSIGRLDGITEILPDVDFFIFMYIRKEAVLSSQIEGTQSTFTDVLKAEAKIENTEIKKDADEIINYIKAMNYGLERTASLPLSLRLINEIHGILLTGVRGEHKSPGEFRTSQNWVGGPTINTATFVPPPPHIIMELMGNLEDFMYKYKEIPALIKAGIIHYQFETIHPYLDGNGRIGRLLITFYLCRQKILKKPLLYLSEFFKKSRQDYYNKLDAARVNGDIEGWLKFFLTGIVEISEKAVDTARKIVTLRENDIKKITGFGRTAKKAMVLLNTLYRTPIVRVKDIERITSTKNPNALALTSKLVKMGILHEMTGKKKNRIFAYQNYIKLFE